jgi:hypothetical protein
MSVLCAVGPAAARPPPAPRVPGVGGRARERTAGRGASRAGGVYRTLCRPAYARTAPHTGPTPGPTAVPEFAPVRSTAVGPGPCPGRVRSAGRRDAPRDARRARVPACPRGAATREREGRQTERGHRTRGRVVPRAFIVLSVVRARLVSEHSVATRRRPSRPDTTHRPDGRHPTSTRARPKAKHTTGAGAACTHASDRTQRRKERGEASVERVELAHVERSVAVGIGMCSRHAAGTRSRERERRKRHREACRVTARPSTT